MTRSMPVMVKRELRFDHWVGEVRLMDEFVELEVRAGEAWCVFFCGCESESVRNSGWHARV